ncbi:MAG: hypothetical protein ACRCS9_14395 [Hyphomicrobium sp.]
MTKATRILAGLFLATTTLTSAAEAGGVRLQFGGPLGSFVARPHQSYGGSSYAYKERHCAPKRAYSPGRSYAAEAAARRAKRAQIAEAQAQRAKRAAQHKVELAEASAPRAKKVRHLIETVEAKRTIIRTAKLKDETTISDAAPSIVVPETPPAAATVSGTQATAAVTPATTVETATPDTSVKTDPAAAPVVTAATEPVVAAETVTEPVKTEKAAPAAKSDDIASNLKRVCRRFSGLVGALIDVPCGD